jgi:hypothetical protein
LITRSLVLEIGVGAVVVISCVILEK